MRISTNEGFAFGERDSGFRRNGGVFSPEWRILIKKLKVPQFRRKPESPRRRRKVCYAHSAAYLFHRVLKTAAILPSTMSSCAARHCWRYA
ncbi:MAG: hypothetical protein ACR2QC_07440, partial [Gammaproteobacteria bacterium]